MGKSVKPLAVGVTVLLIILFGGGRFYNLALLKGHDPLISLAVAFALSLPISLFGYFGAYLVAAEGRLRAKINYLKLLCLITPLSALFSSYLVKNYRLGGEYHFNFYLLLSILLFINFIIADNLPSFNERVLNFDFNETPPRRYSCIAPLKALLLTIFRLIPYPCPQALYKIGRPTDHAPIIVTGNYELTVRRVVRALQGLDCYLLVADSRGVNIWCATQAGRFGTTELLEAIAVSHLKGKTAMRQLILPQLSAANIDREQLLQGSGFTALFGPVDIAHLRGYLEEREQAGSREVKFGLLQRLEMGLAAPLISLIILFFIYNFLGLSRLLKLIPAIYALSLIGAAIYPYRLFTNSYLRALIYGGLVYGGSSLFWRSGPALDHLILALCSAYLIVEFGGWSPLVDFSFLPAKTVALHVDPERCSGCALCCRVCPRAVFRMKGGKARVEEPANCIHCRACLKQCRERAIKFIE